MKKLLLMLITSAMLLSCFACKSKDSEKKPDDKPAGPKVTAWATHITDKQIANRKPENEGKTTEYTVYMTKGETEGCQLIIRSSGDIKRAAFTLKSGKNDHVSSQAFIMNRTHTISRKEWTDSAIPYYGTKTRISADTIVPFIVDFTTTKDTPAGEYVFTYEFADTETEAVLASFKVTVHVWDIVLPEEKTFATAMDINPYYIKKVGDVDPSAYLKYYNTLLEHNVSAYTLPYDILDERADEYMSDPRVTSFVVELWEADDMSDEALLKIYDKLKTNPVWLDKAMFYVIDEPNELGKIDDYKEVAERLQTLCPGVEVIAPFYTNLKTDAKQDQVDAMAGVTQLWCPKLCLWDDERAYNDFGINWQSKSFAERMKEFQNEGDTVWAYVCNDPIDPYAQLFIDTAGVNQRLMFWQMYQREIEGFLYWGTNSYGEDDNGNGYNPWERVHNGINDGDGRPVYGEGYLMYPGNKIGMTGAIPSSRLKIVRDGIDDIELMYLAEELLGRDWVMAKVNEATPDLESYIDEENFYRLRLEIGNAVEDELKK